MSGVSPPAFATGPGRPAPAAGCPCDLCAAHRVRRPGAWPFRCHRTAAEAMGRRAGLAQLLADAEAVGVDARTRALAAFVAQGFTGLSLDDGVLDEGGLTEVAADGSPQAGEAGGHGG